MLECLEFLVQPLKRSKGTPAEIDLIEQKIAKTRQEIELTDPMLERILNLQTTITINGHHKF